MEEEIKQEESQEQEKPKPKTMLMQIQEEREKLENALKVQSEMLGRMEEIAALNLLGGKSEAGKAQEISKEIDPKDYAKMALEGKIKPKEK